MSSILQWQIHWVSLEPVQGSEQGGTRPVLVVSSEIVHGSLPVCTILPITTRKAGRRIYPVEVLLPEGTGGLSADSIVMAQQIRTLSKTRFIGLCGELDEMSLREAVRTAMRKHLSL
jgi:mRNA interferase MazF